MTETICPLTPTTLTLSDVLQRFGREARQHVCDTGRYRCPYFTWGEGPPLVFVHGLSDTSHSFLMTMALLAPHFRCVGYELPRGGADGARLGRLSHADLAADLLALLDHLGARQGYLFGSSFGSTVVLTALHAHPARWPRAVLAGGFARRRLAPAELLLAGLARYWPGTTDGLPLRRTIQRHNHHRAFAALEPERWEFFLTQSGSNSLAAVARRALLMHRLDLRPLLPAIRQPVLLLCGDDDPVVGKSCEAELLRGLPHVSRMELAGCGHLPQYTHPEPLAELVRRFLTPGLSPLCSA